MHNREQTMTRFVFLAGVLTLGIAAATPARADYALVRWTDGTCRIWWEAAATPWGTGWAKVAVAPDFAAASAAFDAAVRAGTCK
jgi:hypothetical protein